MVKIPKNSVKQEEAILLTPYIASITCSQFTALNLGSQPVVMLISYNIEGV